MKKAILVLPVRSKSPQIAGAQSTTFSAFLESTQSPPFQQQFFPQIPRQPRLEPVLFLRHRPLESREGRKVRRKMAMLGGVESLKNSNRIEAWTSAIASDLPAPYFTTLTQRTQDGGGALPGLDPSAPPAYPGDEEHPVQRAAAAVSGIALLVRAVQARLDATAQASGGGARLPDSPRCPALI